MLTSQLGQERGREEVREVSGTKEPRERGAEGRVLVVPHLLHADGDALLAGVRPGQGQAACSPWRRKRSIELGSLVL